MKYFQLTPESVAMQLNSNLARGLTADQVRLKQTANGKNDFVQLEKTSFFSNFSVYLKDYTVIILLVGALIYAFVSLFRREYLHLLSAFVMAVIAVLNAVIGVLQQNKAKKTVSALQKLISPKACVIRNGAEKIVSSEDLVCGDILVLRAGDVVTADARIFVSESLKIDENTLSGETLATAKDTDIISGDNHVVSDLHNMVFAGTTVLEGEGRAIVTAIGSETQFGKIAGFVGQQQQHKTPLQLQVSQMGKVLGLGWLLLCTLIFILGLVTKKHFLNIFLTSVSLAVAMAPEGMNAAISLILSFRVKLLSKRNAVVKSMNTLESLGNVSVICTDKSGTLTKNRMKVQSCFVSGNFYPFVEQNYAKTAELIYYGSMCNDATESEGDSTERAIIEAMLCFGKDKQYLDQLFPRMGVIPFDSERKCKTTVHVISGRNLVIVKGAPDTLYPKCVQNDLDAFKKAEVRMAKAGLRVLAIAVKEIDVIPSQLFSEEMENDLTMLGLIAMNDPPRAEVVKSISLCATAGIRPIMITGDHIVTAKAMAKQMGIFHDGDIALSGAELQGLSEDEFIETVKKCSVFARVSPEQKVEIVQALQRNGEVVAMTGDGVNDAPALECADVGCAMGKSGTELAVSASDLVVLDDDFTTIVTAVRHSRAACNNIHKAVSYLLSSNVAQALLILLSVLFIFNIPLLPMQILWMNLFVFLLPSLSLGEEKARKALMKRPPRDKNNLFLSKSSVIKIICNGIIFAAVTVLAFLCGTEFDVRTLQADLLSRGQTMAFAVLSISQIFAAFSAKSRHSVFRVGMFDNRFLNISALLSLLMVVFVIVTPGVSLIFGTVLLGGGQWLVVIVLSILPFVVFETTKLIAGIVKK